MASSTTLANLWGAKESSFEVSRDAAAFVCLTDPQQHVLMRDLLLTFLGRRGESAEGAVCHWWGLSEA